MLRTRTVLGRTVLLSATMSLILGAAPALSNAQATASATPPATQPAPDLPPPADAQRQARLDRVAEVAALNIARAHGDQYWRQHEALQADFEIAIPNQPALAGTVILETKRDRARLNFKNGATLLFDGSAAHMWPSDAKIEAPLFHLRTWPALIAAPFRLHDPSIKATSFQRRAIGDELLGSYTLTPVPNHANPPFDSAVAFYDPRSIIMRGIALDPGVKAPTGLDAADRLLVILKENQTVQNTTFSSSWSIHSWQEHVAAVGESLGQVTITNISYITIAADAFAPAPGARQLAEGQ